MNYEVILYMVFTFIAAYGISGINFNGLVRQGKVIEARILAMLFSIALGYLVTRFFLEVTGL